MDLSVRKSSELVVLLVMHKPHSQKIRTVSFSNEQVKN